MNGIQRKGCNRESCGEWDTLASALDHFALSSGAGNILFPVESAEYPGLDPRLHCIGDNCLLPPVAVIYAPAIVPLRVSGPSGIL